MYIIFLTHMPYNGYHLVQGISNDLNVQFIKVGLRDATLEVRCCEKEGAYLLTETQRELTQWCVN